MLEVFEKALYLRNTDNSGMQQSHFALNVRCPADFSIYSNRNLSLFFYMIFQNQQKTRRSTVKNNYNGT